MTKPLRTITFTCHDRTWIVSEWRNTEGAPSTFYNLTPSNKRRPIPQHYEWLRARAAFDRWLSKPPKDAA